MALNYQQYLKLDQLLNLQQPMSDPPEHDEPLFIIIHQTYELWFKLLMHELRKAGDDLSHNRLYPAIATFKRCCTILKTLVGQMDILETMTPMSFSAFRDRLDTSSGFQSQQYRELEFLLGYRRPEMIRHQPEESAKQILTKQLQQPSLVDHYYRFLQHQGANLPASLLQRDVSKPIELNQASRDAALQLFTTRPDLAILFELMVDFDEGLQEWRYRHVKLVERTIGHKKGTGGSLGVEFLKQSLFKPVFPDLWDIRRDL